MMAADDGEDAAPALPDFEVMAQPPAGPALPPAAAHLMPDVQTAAALPPPALLPAPECVADSLTCHVLARSRMRDRAYTSAPFGFGPFTAMCVLAVCPLPSHSIQAVDMAGTTPCPPYRCRRRRSCYPCPQNRLALRPATTENLTHRRRRQRGAHRPLRRRSRRPCPTLMAGKRQMSRLRSCQGWGPTPALTGRSASAAAGATLSQSRRRLDLRRRRPSAHLRLPPRSNRQCRLRTRSGPIQGRTEARTHSGRVVQAPRLSRMATCRRHRPSSRSRRATVREQPAMAWLPPTVRRRPRSQPSWCREAAVPLRPGRLDGAGGSWRRPQKPQPQRTPGRKRRRRSCCSSASRCPLPRRRVRQSQHPRPRRRRASPCGPARASRPGWWPRRRLRRRGGRRRAERRPAVSKAHGPAWPSFSRVRNPAQRRRLPPVCQHSSRRRCRCRRRG